MPISFIQNNRVAYSTSVTFTKAKSASLMVHSPGCFIRVKWVGCFLAVGPHLVFTIRRYTRTDNTMVVMVGSIYQFKGNEKANANLYQNAPEDYSSIVLARLLLVPA